MDPSKLLDDAQAMTPTELCTFAREKGDNMDGLELYALTLALTTKLQTMIDDQAASIRFDFRRVADHLEAAELARPMDGLAPENAAQIEQTANLADIYHAAKSAQRAIDDAELAKSAADWEQVP